MTIKAHGIPAPSHLAGNKAWQFRLTRYPHFDGPISIKEASELVTSPERVAKHTFFPFIRYESRWTRFAEKGHPGKVKTRPIRYAGRRDSAIYSYYRHLLSERYEAELCTRGLSDSILVYRRVVGSDGKGKCNINFALEAFTSIRDMGDCCAIALDISSFFESIDHSLLKRRWCDLLGTRELPPDHHAVFRAITAYSVVERRALYERLGLFGPKRKAKDGTDIPGYLKSKADFPIQLCSGKEFQLVVAGGDKSKGKSLIEVNRKPYGIPQGSPISDLLANFYLLEFDEEVADQVAALGGRYFRYSDDILIIVPVSATCACQLENWVRSCIEKQGAKLRIKAEKSAVFEYRCFAGGQGWSRVRGVQGSNGLEYLGFRFDGRHAFLRDSTLSNLRRKASMSAKRLAFSLVKMYPGRDANEILELFNLSAFLQRYGRVHDFESKAHEVRNWTFWTYAKRASSVMGPLGDPIFRQLRNHRRHFREAVKRALEARLNASA